MVSIFNIKKAFLKKQLEKEQKRKLVEEARLRRLAQEESELENIRKKIKKAQGRELTSDEKRVLEDRKKRIAAKKAQAKKTIDTTLKVAKKIVIQADRFVQEKPKKKKKSVKKRVTKKKLSRKKTVKKRVVKKKVKKGKKIGKEDAALVGLDVAEIFF